MRFVIVKAFVVKEHVIITGLGVLNVVNAEPSDPLVALTVTDALGNQCLTMTDFSSQNPIRVDVAPLSNGFYFVRTISTSGKISHFSFIKL